MKRVFDAVAAGAGLLVLSPILIPIAIAIWLQDYHSPFYIAPRMGLGNRPFRMVKFRSMVVRADKTGVDSTAGDDPRITAVGRFVRRFKFDEVPQLWNVLKGEMSLVGPRPNVQRETALYTREELRLLLEARPGITDMASIVFADEGEILAGSDDPDILYNQIIRPWKSRLALLYVDNQGSIARDLKLIWLTAMGSWNRRRALDEVAEMARELGADDELVQVARRQDPLRAAPPPGATEIVRTRELATT